LLGGPGKHWLLGGNERRPAGGDKNLAGGPGNDGVVPGLGSDNADGGDGNDFFSESTLREALKDSYVGGDGNDVFDAENRPAARDVVVCGEGFDRVLADSKDEVTPDCERVLFGLSTEEFFETVPQSFFEGLAPIPVG
jgi:Ca2+-binding RTX toxin-like protein